MRVGWGNVRDFIMYTSIYIFVFLCNETALEFYLDPPEF